MNDSPLVTNGRMGTATIAELVDLWVEYTEDVNRRNKPILDEYQRQYEASGIIPLPIDRHGRFVTIEEPSFVGFMNWLAIRRYEARKNQGDVV